MCCFVHSLNLAFGGRGGVAFDRGSQILEEGGKITQAKHTQNKSAIKSDMLIFNYLLALELLWWPWQLVTLFPLSVCSSHQVLFAQVLASSTFAAVLQTGCGKIQDRDIF